MNAAIVIPSIRVDPLLERCVSECRRECPAVDIVVVVDDDESGERIASMARLVVTSGLTIASKRNLGVSMTDAANVAFIDSDAYPAPGWLLNAVRLLEEDPRLGAVGGPNVSPPAQHGSQRYVGMAHRSFLVDGWWTFRKNPQAHARDVVALPTCNLVVRRSDFEALGGMNERLFTAEDTDFCSRLVASGRRIRFSPDVLVYHKDRSLRSFVVQRFTFGVAMVPLVRKGAAPDLAYCGVSAALLLFVLFVLSGPLAIVSRRWRTWWSAGIGAYCALLVAEAVRVSPSARDVPGAAVALAIGNSAPGVGLLLRILSLSPSLEGVYRNDR